MTDSLRDALEKLVQEWQYTGEPVDMTRTDTVMDDCADELKRVLAAHPVEPADERECLATRTLGITPHVCLLHPGHESDHQWTADREHPAEPVGVSDEAAKAGAKRLVAWVFADDPKADFDWSGMDGRDKLEAVECMRVALEAAQPFMGAIPVASRERVAEVLREAGDIHPHIILSGWFGHAANELLAAGVFREPPTPEQVLSAIGDTLNRRIEYIEDHATVQSAYEAATDAVLHLLGGAS